MIKIGTRAGILAQKQADPLLRILDQNELDYAVTIYDNENGEAGASDPEENDYFTKEMDDALLKGEIDIAVHPLTTISPEKRGDLVTSGISERSDPSDLLLIRKDSYVETSSFKLKENARVGVSSKRQQVLIAHFRPDIRIEKIDGDIGFCIEVLRAEELDGLIVSKANMDLLEIDVFDFVNLVLNPREFVPAPGQGVIAYQTRAEDRELRENLARWTNRKLVRIINVERKIFQLTGGTVGAFCEMDAMGHFHVWAFLAGDDGAGLKFVQYSSSTNHQLPETIVKKLRNDIDI